MESSEEQIIIKTMDEETSASYSNTKSHNSGLRALLSIKKRSVTLDKDYSELLLIENELDEAFKNGLLIIQANASPEESVRWESVMQEVNYALKGIHDTLTAAKEKMSQNEKDGYPYLWNELSVHLTVLRDNSKNAANSGRRFLPEAVHPQWEEEFVQLATPLIESIIIHADSFRVLQQMIERCTPIELNAITQLAGGTHQSPSERVMMERWVDGEEINL